MNQSIIRSAINLMGPEPSGFIQLRKFLVDRGK
jgi:hypothetical protein